MTPEQYDANEFLQAGTPQKNPSQPTERGVVINWGSDPNCLSYGNHKSSGTKMTKNKPSHSLNRKQVRAMRRLSAARQTRWIDIADQFDVSVAVVFDVLGIRAHRAVIAAWERQRAQEKSL